MCWDVAQYKLEFLSHYTEQCCCYLKERGFNAADQDHGYRTT
jgi:hypothetical protein